jgi:hypothetical protein
VSRFAPVEEGTRARSVRHRRRSRGNLTLWLNDFGLYDRKATESSNVVLLPPSHAAQEPLASADRVEIHGEVSILDPGDIHLSGTLGVNFGIKLAEFCELVCG